MVTKTIGSIKILRTCHHCFLLWALKCYEGLLVSRVMSVGSASWHVTRDTWHVTRILHRDAGHLLRHVWQMALPEHGGNNDKVSGAGWINIYEVDISTLSTLSTLSTHILQSELPWLWPSVGRPRAKRGCLRQLLLSDELVKRVLLGEDGGLAHLWG